MEDQKTPIGEELIQQEVISEKELEEALAVQQRSGGFLGEIIINLGFSGPKEVGEALAKRLGVPYADLSEENVDPNVSQLVPEHMVRQQLVFPLKIEGDTIHAAMADPLNLAAIDDLRALTGKRVTPLLAMEHDLLNVINRHFDIRRHSEQAIKDIESDQAIVAEELEEPSADQLLSMAGDAPVVRLVNSVMFGALSHSVSDIHLEPQSDAMRVRYRRDGLLYDHMTIPRNHQAAVVSRVKIMARMNIAERRKSQDGRIQLNSRGKQYDLRISTMPTIFGEKVVMRVLDKSTMQVPFERLGFLPEEEEIFNWLIKRPYGLILVTGPTGSGKSTSLYAALSKINHPTQNIMTIEDPVEYQLPGVNQTAVNPKAGVTFASGLRSMVRQDPDIIMVGEIRDLETAEIAVQAALTGHLVFSTLHTNDAPSALVRLMDMGVEPFLISSAVIGVIAQRLVRMVCDRCQEQYEPDPGLLTEIGIDTNGKPIPKLWRGAGCRHCNSTGYSGRSAVFEVLKMDESLRALVLKRSAATVLREQAIAQGMRTMQDTAARKVLDGLSTPEEVLRVVFVEQG